MSNFKPFFYIETEHSDEHCNLSTLSMYVSEEQYYDVLAIILQNPATYKSIFKNDTTTN